MKHFRDDLWYRLSSAVIRVPPLRERPEDVLAFLQLKLLRNSTLRVVDALSPAALRCVLADPLPGNFRDLENFVDRLPAAQRPGEIEVAQVEAALREAGVDEFIHVGVDVLASLELAHAELGLGS